MECALARDIPTLLKLLGAKISSTETAFLAYPDIDISKSDLQLQRLMLPFSLISYGDLEYEELALMM